jgi:hypothetical protein
MTPSRHRRRWSARNRLWRLDASPGAPARALHPGDRTHRAPLLDDGGRCPQWERDQLLQEHQHHWRITPAVCYRCRQIFSRRAARPGHNLSSVAPPSITAVIAKRNNTRQVAAAPSAGLTAPGRRRAGHFRRHRSRHLSPLREGLERPAQHPRRPPTTGPRGQPGAPPPVRRVRPPRGDRARGMACS